MNKMYRQGDVLIERVDVLTKELKKHNKITLAFGEVTGHSHAIDCDLMANVSELGLATEFEVAEAMALLKHEEHSTIELPAGKYRVIHQREYSPEAIRNVMD